ncbi:tRNA pseudouridine(55) synthase TruB [Arenicellales bacterium IMCC55707]
MGRKRKRTFGDSVDGILLLDKHAGVTSNQALQSVRKLLNAKKAGHTGSLDPIATGLLPICFGNTTKWSGYFLGAPKHYMTTVRLGESTETGDSEGDILKKVEHQVTQSQIESALESFRGIYQQVPPMYSAIKVNGQPLYKLARQGIEIERESREVDVTYLDLIDFNGQDATLELKCSSGFYVRALATELGDMLGVGGHVISLRRVGVAGLDLENAVTVSHLEGLASPQDRRGMLGDIGDALSHFPAVDLSVDAAFYICRGESVKSSKLPDKGLVRLYSPATGFLGIGVVSDHGTVSPERLISNS